MKRFLSVFFAIACACIVPLATAEPIKFADAPPMFEPAQINDLPKHVVPPPIHSVKGVIASPWNKEHVRHPRGLKRTPLHKILNAKRFDRSNIKIPTQVTMLPTQLSMWGNSQYGDCVSASEAAAKAAYSVYCGLPETFIPEANVISWAKAGGYLNGADLTDVMTTMQTTGMVAADGKTYTDGPYTKVDYSNVPELQAALVIGPVNIGIDADALPSGAGNGSGWYAFGGTPGSFTNEDHCVRLFGYGPTAALFTAINAAYGSSATPPANAPASSYLIYTWSGVGVVDQAWVMSTVGEAWSQNPTTVGQTPAPAPAPAPPNPTPNPTPTPIPTPSPSPSPGPTPVNQAVTITGTVTQGTAAYEMAPAGTTAALTKLQQDFAALQALAGKQAAKISLPPPAKDVRIDAIERQIGVLADAVKTLQGVVGNSKK